MDTEDTLKLEQPEGEMSSGNAALEGTELTESSANKKTDGDGNNDSNKITNTQDIDTGLQESEKQTSESENSTSSNAAITNSQDNVPEFQDNPVLKCEPCVYRNLDVIATKYCKECDEQYCDSCTFSHTSQKQTKSHIILDIKEASQDTKEKCEPCSCKQKYTDATFICQDCEEYLCLECKEFHLSQKRNKKHVIKPLINQILCATCKSRGQDAMATLFCKDCDDPEPFCVTCADQHTAMKISRNHQLSSEVDLLIKETKVSTPSCKVDL